MAKLLPDHVSQADGFDNYYEGPLYLGKEVDDAVTDLLLAINKFSQTKKGSKVPWDIRRGVDYQVELFKRKRFVNPRVAIALRNSSLDWVKIFHRAYVGYSHVFDDVDGDYEYVAVKLAEFLKSSWFGSYLDDVNLKFKQDLMKKIEVTASLKADIDFTIQEAKKLKRAKRG